MFRFPRILAMENGTDWKLNQPMSPAFFLCERGYIDLLCTSKRFQDIKENVKTKKVLRKKICVLPNSAMGTKSIFSAIFSHTYSAL